MNTSNKMVKFGLKKAFSYIEKNPEQNMPKLMALVDRFAGDGPDSFPSQRAAIRNVINDKDSNMYQLIMKVMNETDTDVLKTVFENFFINANLAGWKKQEEYR